MTESLTHKRLAMIVRRLVAVGAVPVVALDEIGHLNDDEADHVANAEADRLAILVQIQTEQAHGTPRKAPNGRPDEQLNAEMDRRFGRRRPK